MIQSEVAQAIRQLDDRDGFDIITFHTPIYICFGTLTSATTNAKSMAIGWVYSQGTDGCSNDYDGLKAAFENYGVVDTIQYMSDGYPDTALSRGCCGCCCNPAAWILNAADAWIASQVAGNPSFLLEVIQVGGSPIGYMVALGNKSHASFELR